MRKWKDEGTPIFKPWTIKLLTAFACIGFFFGPVDIFVFHVFILQDWLNIGMAIFLLWGVRRNGFYKITRWLTEYYLKKKDNKFDYFSK